MGCGSPAKIAFRHKADNISPWRNAILQLSQNRIPPSHHRPQLHQSPQFPGFRFLLPNAQIQDLRFGLHLPQYRVQTPHHPAPYPDFLIP